MKKVADIINRAEQNCKIRGSRLTHKRKQVLSSLIQAEKALSAYELLDIYKAEFGQTIPAMSMYRILDFLQGEHLVHKLNLANKYIACAHISCDHSHAVPQFLICSKCQKVEEISIGRSTITKLQKNVENAGFRLVTPQLEMNCICENCVVNAA